MDKLLIEINGKVETVTDVKDDNFLVIKEKEYYIFQDSEAAGEAAREYWTELAESDPEELAFIVGEKALIAWGLGREYAVGSIGVSSLEDWLNLWEDVPEEHFASYDGLEVAARINKKLQRELFFDSGEVVVYRAD
ncbi:MAG: hypothetical protein DRN81_06840 [Thermoproteota archaeon]|nr:MAG: hypothetical protein DRN81_06840 [Candidatus Korarchaeota archaeon]